MKKSSTRTGWVKPFVLFLLASTSVASAANTDKVLYSFQAHADGYLPSGGVIIDSQGNLYGATSGGGTPGVGEIFELSPPAKHGGPWTETIIYSLQGGSDGDIASSGVISDSNGNLYGVAEYGGTGQCTITGIVVGCGVAYELSPPTTPGGTWTETVMYSFQGGTDGDYPSGNLLIDGKGNLYGITEYGGDSKTNCSAAGPGCGTVFELSPPANKGDSWTEKVLYSFKGNSDGGYPNGPLVFDQHGALYGTTFYGGNQGCSGNGSVGCGTVFALKPQNGGGWTEKILRRFAGEPKDGGNPHAGVIFDSKGNLYGTTEGGGTDSFGSVFELTPSHGGHWKEAVLYDFVSEGNYPQAPLTLSDSGDLYGVACCSKYGNVFRLAPADGNSWNYSVVHSFEDTPDGAYAAASVIFDRHGTLYGTTMLGGTGTECDYDGVVGCGTVFALKP